MNGVLLLDFAILDWIQDHMKCAFLDRTMPAVSLLGTGGLIWIALALILLAVKSRRRCGAMLCAALAADGILINLVIKNIVHRERPIWISPPLDILVKIPTDYSFPSGHTAAGFAAAAVLLYYDRRIGIPVLAFSCVMAFSRMYLYVHFPSDVLGGVLIGSAIGVIMIVLINRRFGKPAGRIRPEKTT